MTDLLCFPPLRSDASTWPLGLRHELVHESIWSSLRTELELAERFQELVFKLRMVRNNALFFLEVKQHDRSTALEWVIVLLVALEILVCFYDIRKSIMSRHKYLDELMETLPPA